MSRRQSSAAQSSSAAAWRGSSAARVLADHFENVTIIERDPARSAAQFPARRAARPPCTRSVAARSAHDLRLFPESAGPDRCRRHADEPGARHALVSFRRMEASLCQRPRGYLREPSADRVDDLASVCVTRRTSRRSTAACVDGLAVRRARRGHSEFDARPKTGGALREFAADLVVDATGRGSHDSRAARRQGSSRPRRKSKSISATRSRIYRASGRRSAIGRCCS